MTKLLSIGADAKTSKGEVLGYRTAVQYLAPSNAYSLATGRQAVNLCPWATEGCRQACLVETSGRMVFTNAVQARLARTALFHSDMEQYLDTLWTELTAFVAQCDRAGMIPAVRLNGGSDIKWEKVFPVLFTAARFESVRWYDYTKALPHTQRADRPANYHLTLSRSESNHAACVEYLRQGGNVAAVIDAGPEGLPATIDGFPVVDGDRHDIRLPELDGRGVWVALKPKGKAKADTTGFVYRVSQAGTQARRIMPLPSV